MPKKPDLKKLEANINSTAIKVKRLEHQLYNAQEGNRLACNRYHDAILPRAKEILLTLEYKQPGRRGRRELTALISRDHELFKMVIPLIEGRRAALLRFDDNQGNTVRIGDDPCSYTSGGEAEVTMGLKSAKLLGIRNPVAKKNWGNLKKKLEAAGITDEDQLAKLLEEQGKAK